MSKEKKLQIRNSTAEFLIFTRQAGEDGIEVRVAGRNGLADAEADGGAVRRGRPNHQ